MKKAFFPILLACGILLRLVLAVTTYHADLKAYSLATKLIVGEGKIFSFYDAVASFDSQGQLTLRPDKLVFHYQPLAYLIPSSFYLPFRQLILNTTDKVVNGSWPSTPIYWPLLLYKYPLIIFDLLVLLILPSFFSDPKKSRLAQILWLFNPLGIYVSSMMGQVDGIIAFWLILAFKFLKDKKYNLAAFLVSVSALIKPIGLVLLPIIAIASLHQKKNIFAAVVPAVIGLATYLLGVLPYYSSPAYRYFSLFAEHINKSTFAGISIANGTQIPWFFIAYSTTLILFLKKKISILPAFIAALFSSLAFTHFHPQWLLWIMPLLTIWAIKTNSLLVYFATIFAWLGILFSFDYTLHTGILLLSRVNFSLSNGNPLLVQFALFCRGFLVALLFKLLCR